MSALLAIILLFPLLGAMTNLLLGRKLPRRGVEVLACSAIWGSAVAALAALATYREPVLVTFGSWLSAFDFSAPFSLLVDPLSLVLTVMITCVCALIHTYAVAYMAEDECYVRFFVLLNLFVFAMLVLVLAGNLPLLYLGWEGVGFCSYALIGFWYREEKNADAGRKAFIVTRVGDVAFGIAVVWLFQLFSTVSITEINAAAFLLPSGVATGIGLLLLVGAMGKSAQLPLSVWLPDAMAGPTPVSAQIHAATMVTAGVYLLARMQPVIGSSQDAMAAIAVTGGLTAFYGASCALVQRDIKRVLAYSTISQIGYMILGVGCGAVAAATFHLLVHAFYKALLFLGAGCVIAACRHEQDIFRMGGLRRKSPLTFWPFLAGAACLAGLPLTGGFFSKDAVLAAAWEKGGSLYGGLFFLGMTAALLTAVYTFRLVYLVFGGPEREPHAPPRLMEVVLLPLALLGLAGGILNLPAWLGGGWLGRFLGTGSGSEQVHGAELILQAAAGITALVGLAIAHVRYGGARRAERLAAAEQQVMGLTAFLLTGWRIDDLYRFLFVRPFVRLAGFFWTKIDEGIIDDSLDRLADLFGRFGEDLGRWTDGRISGYLRSFAAGLALVLAWVAWVMARG